MQYSTSYVLLREGMKIFWGHFCQFKKKREKDALTPLKLGSSLHDSLDFL